jgi:iron-sulfur cluster assembly protein
MAITITEKAVAEMNRVIDEQKLPKENTFLRIGVVGGGCSGFQYKFGFDDKADEAKDQISEHHGLKVAVDRKSALTLDGTTVDFYDGIERRGFVFDNPNAVKTCGCGSSFSA